MSGPTPIRKPYNAADPEQVDEARRRARTEREQAEADMRAVLGTPEGARVLRRILEICHVYQTSFTGHGSRDAFNEGERNVGLQLIAAMNAAAPEGYLNMLKESKPNV